MRRKRDGALLVIKKFLVPMGELPSRERTEVAQEVRLLAFLKHPGIVAYKDSFIEGGVMHIVMEYATGGSLHEFLVKRAGELLPEERVLELFVQVADALRYVHSCNVLHRDLKSQNILLTGPDGRIAKL